jgi:hypothetical protein
MQFESHSYPAAQTDLYLDEELYCCLFEDGDALYVIGDLHELTEGEGLLLFEFGVDVRQDGE